MPDQFFTLGAWTIKTYTAAVALGILVSVGIGFLRLRAQFPAGRIIDVYLGGLIGGVILARAIHVLLNWNFFAYNTGEITAINTGGLDWHGAVIGGLVGMVILCRWRQVDFAKALDSLTPALALIALATWFGCWSTGCGYGAEVTRLADYPARMVWEGPDVFGIYAPRFHTQAIGVAFSLGLVAIMALLMRFGSLRQNRFWIILGVLSAGMFIIGLMRGDYALVANGLRLDQWLDAIMMVVAVAVGLMQTLHRPGHCHEQNHSTLIND